MKKVIDWELLLRYFEGGLSDKDKADLDNWLSADSSNKNILSHLQKIWNIPR